MSLKRRIAYAFLAQAISLLLSVTMVLVLPKVVSVEVFGYWQLFILYVGYAGFLHFGLNDGVYLVLGGRRLSEINHSLIATQFKISLVLQACVAMVGVFAATTFVEDAGRRSVIVAASVYLVSSNASLFLGYLFQAVNHTEWYSTSVIVDRIVALLLVCALLLFGVRTLEPLMIAYGVANLCKLTYCVFLARSVLLAHWHPIRGTLREMVANVAVGSKLMLANVAGLLIVGSGLMLVDFSQGIVAFAQFSLAFTLTSFFLLFVGQVGMVLFPALRSVTPARLSALYQVSKEAIGLALPLVFLVYIPLRHLLQIWLPQYQLSLQYLALLLPICIFDGKMQLLFGTYLKVMREERRLLLFNMASLGLSLALSLFGALVLHNVYFVIVAVVASICFRSILCELFLNAQIAGSSFNGTVGEIMLVLALSACGWYLGDLWALVAISGLYALFLAINYRRLQSALILSRRLWLRTS